MESFDETYWKLNRNTAASHAHQRAVDHGQCEAGPWQPQRGERAVEQRAHRGLHEAQPDCRLQREVLLEPR